MAKNKVKSVTTRRKTPVLISQKSPFVYSESYRTLRTNLNFASSTMSQKSIVVTSTRSEEGKSTVAINLAITLAQEGKRVILVDADLRKPSLQYYLKIKPGQIDGLSGYLSGQFTEKEVIGYYEMFDLDVILSGRRPPNPAELLSTEKMGALIQNLESKYDYVIVDAPPVGIVTDAAVLSRYCGGVLLVIRQNFASKREVSQAMEQLTKAQANVIGSVLNNYDITKNMKADAQSYYYYYGDSQ